VGACGDSDIAVHGGVDKGAANAAVSSITAIGVTTCTDVYLIHNGPNMTALAVVACGDLDIAVHSGVDTGAANVAVSSITAIGVTTSTDMELIHNGSTITASVVFAWGNLDIAVHGGVDTGAAYAAVSSVTGVAGATCKHM